MALLTSKPQHFAAPDLTRQTVTYRNGHPLVAFKNPAFLGAYYAPPAAKPRTIPPPPQVYKVPTAAATVATQVQEAAPSSRAVTTAGFKNPLSNPLVKYGIAGIIGLSLAAGIYHAVN